MRCRSNAGGCHGAAQSCDSTPRGSGRGGEPELRRKLLTFVVGGGGFSGVEVIAEMNDFVHAVKKNYLRLRNEPHRCVIVQSEPDPAGNVRAAGGFCAKDAAKTRRRNPAQGQLLSATSEKAMLESGIEIPCKTSCPPCPPRCPGDRRNWIARRSAASSQPTRVWN